MVKKANDMFYVPSFRFSISLLFLMERYLASFGFDIILSVIFTSVCIAVSASCLGAVLKDRKAVSMLIDPLGVTIPDVELLLDRPMLPAPLPSFEVGLLRDKSTVLPSVMFSDANDSLSPFSTLPKNISRCNSFGHFISNCTASIKLPTLPLIGTLTGVGLLSPLFRVEW